MSRITKQIKQDPDRHDDCDSLAVKCDKRTEVKDDGNGTNQILRDAQVPKVTSNSANSKNATNNIAYGRAALAPCHAHSNAHDRTVALGPPDNNHFSRPYFPLNYKFHSHSSHNYYKSHLCHRNRDYYYLRHNYHHRRHRPYSPPANSAAVNNRMAPFDDSTLATRNISKNKKTTGNRPLTVDTTYCKSDKNERTELYFHSDPPASYPASYPPNHNPYYHHPGSYNGGGVNGPRELHYEFSDNGSAMEYDCAYSTTPIAINTPQRSNKSSQVEARNQNEGNEEEHHAHSNSNDALHNGDYYARWKYSRNGSGYYNQSSHDAHPRDHSKHQGQMPTETKTNGKNRSTRSMAAFAHPLEEDNRSASHPSVYYRRGWYSAYESPQHTYPPQEPFDRHYFSPSPPPPPPPSSEYPDYFIPSSDTFASRASSPPLSWYEGDRGSYDEHDANRRASSHPTANHVGYYHPDSQPAPQEKEKQLPGTPSSGESAKAIPKVTPRKAIGRNSPIISNHDMKTNHSSSSSSNTKAIVTPSDKSCAAAGASTFAPSSPFVTLRDSDIVCGRGAPTNFHIGNSRFRELVFDYHRSYFVAKRSDKPRIAMKVLDVLSSRGARFVRRIKGGSSASSHWEEVAHKIAYEKICQALRDAGGPPRQMLSSVAASGLKSKPSGKKGSDKLQEMVHVNISNNNLPLLHQQGGIVTKNGSMNGGEEGKENDIIDHF